MVVLEVLVALLELLAALELALLEEVDLEVDLAEDLVTFVRDFLCKESVQYLRARLRYTGDSDGTVSIRITVEPTSRNRVVLLRLADSSR